MARRLVASLSVPARTGTYTTAASPMEQYQNCLSRLRAPDAVSQFSARIVVEHSDDYDPATQQGTWTAIGALRTTALNASNRAELRPLAELARPRGGFIRLRIDVTSGNPEDRITGELWAEAKTYEDALNLPIGSRARPQDLDDRRDLSDPNVG